MADLPNQFKDFKYIEVIFKDEKQELQRIVCTVKSIEDDIIILDAENSKNNNVFASMNDNLNIHIYTDNGVYSADSEVLLVVNGLTSTEYTIAYPENINHSQRREYFRADLNIDFRLELETKDAPGTVLIIQAKARDVSGRGMSYISDKPLPALIGINMKLYFPEKTIETAAKLVNSRQIDTYSGVRFIHAFYLTTISQKDIDFIVKKCFLYQLELRQRLKN